MEIKTNRIAALNNQKKSIKFAIGNEIRSVYI